MNIHSKNKDALSGNLLVAGNSPDALTIGGTRGARYIRLGYSVRSLAAFQVGVKLPIATESIGKILCGELRYADIANRALKKLMPFQNEVRGKKEYS